MTPEIKWMFEQMLDKMKAQDEQIKQLEKKIDTRYKEYLDLKKHYIEVCEELENAEHDRAYIEAWNRDQDRFERDAYGEPTYEEGGIADYTGSSSHINSAGEPDGWWK